MNDIFQPNYQGKIRDMYDLGNQLILVSTDRISAFDTIFRETIKNKGFFLNQISILWFQYFSEINNHLLEIDLKKFPSPYCKKKDWEFRSVLVKKCKRIDYECVVRGYLYGSAYEEYKINQTVSGKIYPKNLKKGCKLSEVVFTPAIKSETKDINISEEELKEKIGNKVFSYLKETSIYIYQKAASLLETQNFLLFDTKFEFGFDENNQILLIDELLTPDSSRYVDKNSYLLGKIENFDKQIFRDYLLEMGWKPEKPLINLSEKLTLQISKKYKIIYERLKKCLL